MVAALLSLLASGCSEEDRRAWVSILPLPEAKEDGSSATLDAGPAGELKLGVDSTAVLLGADTLFTIQQIPPLDRGQAARSAIRFRRISLAPDSTRVAFTAEGGGGSVGVWWRPLQVARIADVFRGGQADSIAWSADGRYLAYAGRSENGVARTGIHDARIGLTLDHPVAVWLARNDRSVRLQGWLDEQRLRVLVAPGPVPVGGLAHIWDAARGSLMAESHIAPLAAHAPPGATLDQGALFSLDLLGDAAPETVALYRSAGGAPSGLVLESRGSEFRAGTTEPLLAAEALGFEAWGGQGRRAPPSADAALHLVAMLGGRTTLVLRLPSADPPLLALGFFQAGQDGRLEPVTVVTPQGERPAVFYDGRSSQASIQLGLVDLDGDGALEVISATGRAAAGPPEPAIAWRAVVFRWSGGRLVPAPELESLALARIARATRGEREP
ncbi:MAG TPA: hypothetical protein VM737_09990 [Gemmatimonadota bacterium]|nr:hypothetical protein [Gemmatimonadota bacterium]